MAAADTLQGAWQAIGQAQAVLGRAKDDHSLISQPDWLKLQIPSAHGLPVIKKQSKRYDVGELVFHGGDNAGDFYQQSIFVLARINAMVGAQVL